MFGHFHIAKYRNALNIPRITLLRHPLNWVISLYFFVLSQAQTPSDHPIIQYVSKNQITIEQFSRMPSVQNFFTQLMFRGVDMNTIDLIILHEHMSSGVAALEKLFGVPIHLTRKNVTKELVPGYEKRRDEIQSDSRLMSALAYNLKDDILFYERCAALRSVA